MYKRNCEIKPGVSFPEGMQRVVAGIEYNGAVFNGFQKQASTANTVQAKLERALSNVANEEVSCVCAGRTDAGVHASEQIIHFDTLSIRPTKAWVHGANTKLPDDIRVLWASAVDESFHARFSALSRTYRYVIYSADVKPAYLAQLVTWTTNSLVMSDMQEAGELLLGEHDFSCFRSSQCQARSPVRNIESIHFQQHNRFIVMEIKANAFLHHMVRNIIGSLMQVGRGAKPKEWVEQLLAGKDRTKAAATAHPWGLYFVKAHYPARFGLPDTPKGPLFLG